MRRVGTLVTGRAARSERPREGGAHGPGGARGRCPAAHWPHPAISRPGHFATRASCSGDAGPDAARGAPGRSAGGRDPAGRVDLRVRSGFGCGPASADASPARRPVSASARAASPLPGLRRRRGLGGLGGLAAGAVVARDLDALLADLAADRLLVLHPVGADADALHRDGLLGDNRTLLVEDDLLLVLREGRPGARLAAHARLAVDPALLVRDGDRLLDHLGLDPLAHPDAARLVPLSADAHLLLRPGDLGHRGLGALARRLR